jgi:hypothetical protein
MRQRAVFALAVIVVAGAAEAMPNFSRREGFDCTTCHTTIPRLNRFGYDYRNAGFRPPSSVGDPKQKALPDLGTMFVARLQSEPNFVRTKTGSAIKNRGQLAFFETTLYPVTGSFGRWFSSEGEISFAPGEGFEVENAYLRGTFGGEASRFNARFGVFHPWEGYGASDRPISISRPLFQRTPARFGPGGGAQSTFFTPWGLDQAGVELGYTIGGFNVAASVLNGLVVHPEEGAFIVDPFQGGAFSRPDNDPNYNEKDYQVFANQFFGEAALSAHYYHGTLTVPTGTVDAPGPSFTDKFDRASVYGTLPLPRFGGARVPPLSVLAGYLIGWDTGFNGTVTTSKSRSQGVFGELFSSITPMFGASVRYDWFDPSDKASNNEQQAITGALNAAALNGAQGILEYRHRVNDGATKTTIHEVRLRIIYIF